MSDLPQLPKGWQWATIGEVGDVQLGRQRSPKYHSGPNMRPYLRVANVFEDRIDLSDVMQMNFSPEEFDRYKLQPGDILLNEGQSAELVGRPAMYRGELPGACFTNSLIRFRPHSGIDGRYALYLFRYYLHVRRFMREARVTTNIAHLSSRRFSGIEFPVPPSSEQKRIVGALEELLSRLDVAKQRLSEVERRILLLDQSSTDHLFDSKKWPWVTLGEIADIKGGVTKDSKRQNDPALIEVPYLRVANVQRGFLNLDQVSSIRIDSAKSLALRLRQGDVLFNEGGDRDKLGRGWVWEGQIENCIHQNHVFRARLKSGAFDPYFLSIHANTWGRQWFEKHGRQTTNLASINLGTLRKFPVPAPPRQEQSAIVAKFRKSQETQFRLLGSLRIAHKRAGALRRSILAAAFSGRLIRQESSDNPDSMLLGQIRAEEVAETIIGRKKAL